MDPSRTHRPYAPGIGPLFLLFTLAFTCAANAQLEKLFIDGAFTDAVTGKPLIHARMTVTDSLDPKYTFIARASASGEFSAGLYSGAHYALWFEAEGYQPRCAVIDLKLDRDWPDVSMVWKMSMPVTLTPTEAPGRPGGCEWKCVFRPRTAQLEWSQQEARDKFPIVVARNEHSDDELAMDFKNTDNRFLLVKGAVKDLRTDRGLPGARVTFATGTSPDSTVHTDSRGEYEMRMTFDAPFRITYSLDGKVSKIVEIDPRTVPEKERKQGFVSWTDITLFDPIPGADLSFLAEPIGKAAYSAKSGTLEWDMDYSLPRMERLNEILNAQ